MLESDCMNFFLRYSYDFKTYDVRTIKYWLMDSCNKNHQYGCELGTESHFLTLEIHFVKILKKQL